MATYRIIIEGTGPHGNGQPGDADEIIAGAIEALIAHDHDVPVARMEFFDGTEAIDFRPPPPPPPYDFAPLGPALATAIVDGGAVVILSATGVPITDPADPRVAARSAIQALTGIGQAYETLSGGMAWPPGPSLANGTRFMAANEGAVAYDAFLGCPPPTMTDVTYGPAFDTLRHAVWAVAWLHNLLGGAPLTETGLPVRQ